MTMWISNQIWDLYTCEDRGISWARWQEFEIYKAYKEQSDDILSDKISSTPNTFAYMATHL